MDKNTRIAVLGLGREGLDLLRFLRRLKIKPVGLNAEVIPATDPRYADIKRYTSEVRWGKHYLDQLTDLELVFRSPGVPLDLPPLQRAKRRGVQLSSLTQLFFDLCLAKIIGITGTKGKSTTSSLIYHLLKGRRQGRVYFRGNIGHPPLGLLPKLTKADIVILELSSFQLEDVKKSPHLAVVLAVTPEHLDRHKTFRKYLEAKLNLVKYQHKKDIAIVSADEKIAAAVEHIAPGKVIKYSTRKILPRGLYLANGEIIYRDVATGRRQVIMSANEIPLLGKHNLNNALAAILAALVMGTPPSKIGAKVKTFRALPHRLEEVGDIGKIHFIDDSLATTPVATLAALQTLPGEPMSIILGGASKKENFKELVAVLVQQSSVKGVVLIGETADKLYKLFRKGKASFPIIKAKNFTQAVQKAYQLVQPAGVVLLSPACASFGWFKDAYDRGEQFQSLAQKIIKKNKS